MNDDFLFKFDVKGDTRSDSFKPRYRIGADIEPDGPDRKPSQERPAILKKRSKRYHQDISLSKFKPGVMSDELRSALGLRRFDIPEHIYRMRQVGYPPGWLKKCEVVKESMSIIGANSSYKSNSCTDMPKYDCDKLHEYPGFNTYKDYHEDFDNHEARGFWPMQENCLIENLKAQLQDLELVAKEPTELKDIRLSTSDGKMEFNLPENRRKRPMAASTPFRSKFSKDSVERSSLSDGEIDSEDESKRSQIWETSNCQISSVQTDNTDSNDNSLISLPFSNSDITDEGTLLLVSPVKKPNIDDFSNGIGYHRLFENLPNSGGSYSKVKDALMKNSVKNEK